MSNSLNAMVASLKTRIWEAVDKTYYDPLTGIYNRRYFEENLERLMKSLPRYNGSLGLMMIDIDFFKQYNDTYGHNEGDNCLRTVASALSNSITRVDDFVARYGGEEFVVVLPHTGERGLREIAGKLLKNIQDCNIAHIKSDVAHHVTISIGVTTGILNKIQAGEDYVKRADALLYTSKQNGRNRYTFGAMDDPPPLSLKNSP
jgi:diguanylate cyclase (GGDEF)-like protein